MITIEQDFIKAVMNPTRLRIIQFLLLNKTATTAQIRGTLTDIPPASLYRHIKALEHAGLIQVTAENRIRGAVEKVFVLTENPVSEGSDNKTILRMINSSLLSIMGDFTRYLQNEDCDPQRDMIFLTTSTLLLDNEEFMAFTQKLGDVITEYLDNKPREDRKVRRFTYIASPCEEE